MDEVDVHSKLGEGTRVVMSKYILSDKNSLQENEMSNLSSKEACEG